MNRRNYQKELDRIIQKRGKKQPRVLLHSCCGPCSSAVLEYLTQYFDVTLLWYNPNLYPREEFDRRFRTQVEIIEKMGLADKVNILAEPWKSEDYYARIKGLEDEPEGGKRCAECFRLRMMEAARLAKHYGYDYFCTTLTLSRHKDAVLINDIGYCARCRRELAAVRLQEARRRGPLGGAERKIPHLQAALLRLRVLAAPPRGCGTTAAGGSRCKI